MTITAHDADSSASSWCNIYVTKAPSPTLNTSLDKQFNQGNPAISSVFFPSPNSGLIHTGQPTLRIPFGWSFSIGFQSSTFVNEYQNVQYNVLQADGSPLPAWLKWSPNGITLGGVTPNERDFSDPRILHLSLHATDRPGYTASTLPFTLVLADHELGMVGNSLPTFNITAGDSFAFQISRADLAGIQIDGRDLHPEDIGSVMVDVSGNDWLRYNPNNRTLSGQASNHTSALPLPAIISAYGQTIKTSVPIAIVASYFNSQDLGSLNIAGDGKVAFGLRDHLSNATDRKATLSVAFDPPEAAEYLHLNDETLEGTLPDNFPNSTISATFTAYSTTTHSTSHAILSMYYNAPKAKVSHRPSTGAISTSHKKLILALTITFGIVGGVCGLACLLALSRHCIKEKDTALTGEEGMRGWTEKEKQWYGITDEKVGYGWTGSAQDGGHRMGMDLSRSPKSPASPTTPASPNYGNIGLGLHRVMERSQSDENRSAEGGSPGVMSKREFMSKVIRKVSDGYSRVTRPNGKGKPQIAIANIGKPILLHRTQSSSLRNGSSPATSSQPSAKTPVESVATPAAVHFAPHLSRQNSNASTSSVDSVDEAVVHTASFSQQTPVIRPRLVPFTSVTRVPIPQMSVTGPDPDEDGSIVSARVISQTATTNVWRDTPDAPHTPTQSGSGDDLSVGIHYVRALGADRAVEADPSTLTISTNMRSSFSSLDSSSHGHGSEGKALRMIIRVGEQFKFRVPLLGGGNETKKLEAKLITGKPLPGFLRVDYGDDTGFGTIEFYGLPGHKDVGDLDIRVSAKGDRDGLCLARVLLQIVKRT